MMLLVIASGFIVNEVAAPVGPIIGSLVIFGELLASSSIMTPKLEIVVMGPLLVIGRWLLDRHTWSLTMLTLV